MPTTPPTYVSIIGLGLMGTRMAKSIATHPKFQLAQAFDSDPEITQSWSQQFQAQPAQSAVEAMQNSSTDLVYLATPPATHTTLADQALLAGKAVWLEKPLDSDLARAETWVPSTTGKPVWLHFPFATLPGIGAMREALSAGSIGESLRVEIELQFSHWPRTWHTAGPWLAGPNEGGFCREVFSHFAYLTQTLLGPMQLIRHQAEFGPKGTETRVCAQFEANGIPITLSAGVASGAPDFNRWTLFGSKRSFRITDWGHPQESDGSAWTELSPGPGESQGLEASLDQLQLAVAGQAHTLATPADGLAAMRAVEALLSEPNP